VSAVIGNVDLMTCENAPQFAVVAVEENGRDRDFGTERVQFPKDDSEGRSKRTHVLAVARF